MRRDLTQIEHNPRRVHRIRIRLGRMVCPVLHIFLREPLDSGRLEKDIDRKSTRLNSSHDQISYAVFCLKKKKSTTLSPTPSPPLCVSWNLTACSQHAP